MELEFFRLVDRIEAVDPAAGTIRASALVPTHSTVFEGHFPGYPILPGVLLIETMAQTAGNLILVAESFQRMPFLAQVDQAKLRRFVEPATALSVSASLVHLGSGYAVTQAKVETAAGVVAEAGIRFRCLPFPSQEMRELMLAHARRIGLEPPLRA